MDVYGGRGNRALGPCGSGVRIQSQAAPSLEDEVQGGAHARAAPTAGAGVQNSKIEYIQCFKGFEHQQLAKKTTRHRILKTLDLFDF